MAWIKCDEACSAQSYVTVTIDTGKTLDFCGHQYEAREEALRPYEIHKDDRRANLLTRVKSSAMA